MAIISHTSFEGWPNCYRVTNGIISLVVTADVGPRIVYFGFVDGPNEFALLSEDAGLVGGDAFRLYGGHRLWHSPEAMPRTYWPDNQPVEIEQVDGFLRATAPIERATHIRKQIEIQMDDNRAHVRVVHRLINEGMWTVELAPWALTMCAPGGVGIVPLPPVGDHEAKLVPTTSISLWAYTKLADPRWVWSNRFVMLRQDEERSTPQKAGLYAEDSWIAYANNEHLFLKMFPVVAETPYPDRGCNVEMFTNDKFLELETLGPLTRVPPNNVVEHSEDWYLLDGVPQVETESDVDAYVMPSVEEIADGWKS